MSQDRHLFVLGQDLWRSINVDDIISTSHALKELDLYKPPYEDFDIRYTMSTIDYAAFTKQTGEFETGDDEVHTETFRYHIDFSQNPVSYGLSFKIHKNHD